MTTGRDAGVSGLLLRLNDHDHEAVGLLLRPSSGSTRLRLFKQSRGQVQLVRVRVETKRART